MPAFRSRSRLRHAASVALVAMLVPFGTTMPAWAAPDAPPAQSPVENGPALTEPERSALTQAKETGQPVEVADAQTETSTVLANPDGKFTLRSSARPERVRKDGQWHDIDTSLAARADGLLAPVAVTTDVAFSPDGTAPLITLTKRDKRLALSWPTPLPAPTVTGNSAVYPNVFPDVDLHLTATEDGYSQVLAVRTAQAATNPALRQLTLTATAAGLTVTADPGGPLTARDEAGTVVFHGSTPVMWDSRRDDHLGPEPSAAQSGSGRVTPLAIATRPVGSAVELTITPDVAALTGPDVVYPVYIDPQMSGGTLSWSEVTSGGLHYWNDWNQQAQVGTCVGLFPDCGQVTVARSFFNVYTEPLKKRNGLSPTIFSAKFYATVIHSAHGCTAEPIDLYVSDVPVDADTRWPGPNGTHISTDSSAGGDNCTGVSNVMAFEATAAATIATAYDNYAVTFALRAQDEGDNMQWKRFANNPHFDVTYNFPPSVPTGLAVSRAVNCDGRIYTPDAKPTLSATAVDNNPVPLNLGLSFDVYDTTQTNKITYAYPGAWPPSGAVGSWQVNTDLGNGDYNFRAWAFNIDPTNNQQNLGSGWSSFVPFTTIGAPNLSTPGIASFDHPQNNWGVPQGTGGTITVTGTGNHLAGFAYTFNGPGTERVLATTDCDYNKVFGVEGGWTTSNTITVPAGLSPGYHTVHVRSFDKAHNMSAEAGYTFYVAPNTGVTTVKLEGENTQQITAGQPAGQTRPLGPQRAVVGDRTSPSHAWRLDDGAGATAAADSVGTVTATPSGGVAFTTDHGGSAAFTNGRLSTSGPVLTTNQSYTVSAWVKLDSTNAYATAVAQYGGAHNSAFRLYYSPANGGRWVFGLSRNDTADLSDANGIWASASGSPTAWTHLTGVYDATAGKIRLYINGTLAATASGTVGWNSTGKLTIGSETYNGTPTWNFPGSVSDVRTYQRALTDNEANTAYRLWSGESQLFFAGNSLDQSYTMTFNAPIEADYSLGANLTKGPDYGKATFSLDATVLMGTDTAPFDGYSPTATTSYLTLGGAHLTAGTHTITVTMTGTNPASTGNRYQSGVDYLIAAPVNNVTAADLTAAMNNDGISPDGTPARFDLANTSLSAQAMAAAGLSPGSSVTINGASFTLPAPNPTTGYDNVIAAGQTIPLPPAQQIQAGAVGLLVTSTCGDSPETTGTVTYTDNDTTTNPLYPKVSDWATGPTSSAAYVLPYRNTGTAKDTTVRPRIYAVFIAAKPDKTVKSVTLPNIGTSFRTGCADPALHVLAIAPRPAGAGWIGAWSAPADAAVTPQANLANTTLRTVVHPNVTGPQARIRLSNTHSDLPLTIGGASVAAQNGTGAATAATPTGLTFDGSATVTIPPGGEVTSDPVTYPTGGSGNLVVSIHLPNAVTKAATHAVSNSKVYLATGNNTTNSNGTPFTTTLANSYFLTGITVSTPDTTQGTVVVLGDQTTAVGAGTDKTTWVDALPGKLTTAGTPLPGGLVNASTAGVSATSRWKLDDGAGATVATDSAGTNNATKTGNVTFGTDHDGSATFDNGNLATTGPVLTTSQSYTVSAWVKLTGTANYATAVAQYGGAHNSAFRLYYSPTNGGKWIFGTSRADTADLNDTNSLSTQAASTPNTWTHLTGVYDATVGEVRLYVNGVRTGSTPGIIGWNSSGKLTIGSETYNNNPTWYFPGSVSDVRTYPTAATDDDARILHRPGPTTGVQPGLGALTTARAVDSLQRAVLNQPAARTVIISLGTDDILAGADRATIKQRLTTLIKENSATGLNRFHRTDGTPVQVIVTTIAPMGLAPDDPREAVRTQLNQDILTNYTALAATAAIDFDTAVASSPGSRTLNPAYLTDGKPNTAYHDKLAQTVTDAVSGFPPVEL